MIASRTCLPKLLLIAFFVTLLGAAPALAAEAPARAVAPDRAAVAAPAPALPGCAASLDALADLAGLSESAPVCKLDAASTSGRRSCIIGVNCHGYCRCSCSFRRDCNTSADCGGAPCDKFISCC
jgi:hypothetical protein